MSYIKAKKVASYVTLPGIIPRARHLLSSGFGQIAFFIAYIYNMVRLIPDNHPYLNSENIGKFGLRHVIAAAATNLEFSRKNIDQIVIFIAMLAGVVLLAAQFVLLLYFSILQPAMAASIFITPNPGTDIAFTLLDRVFGVPNLFCEGGACTAFSIANPLPLPFHVALQSLFQFYSLALLTIAVLIFLYHFIVLVGESATTGTPFGTRFQSYWAPIRLVVALGLLVPINYGLNSAQYIVLYAAKIGSSVATNGWITFNNTIQAQTAVFTGGVGSNPSGERASLLARAGYPNIAPFLQDMSIIHSCVYTYWKLSQSNTSTSSNIPPHDNFHIKAYLVKNPVAWLGDEPGATAGAGPIKSLEVTRLTTYKQALDFYRNSDIIIRFGERGDQSPPTGSADPENFEGEKGAVKPFCGDLRLKTSDLSYWATATAPGDGSTVGGASQLQEFYFNMVKRIWFGTEGETITIETPVEPPTDPPTTTTSTRAGGNEIDDMILQLSHRYMELRISKDSRSCDATANDMGCNNTTLVLPSCTTAPVECATKWPDANSRQVIINAYQYELNGEIEIAWNQYNTASIDIEIGTQILSQGWGGAGIWYNKIAEINGTFASAVVNLPTLTAYPLVMKKVQEQKRMNNAEPGIDKYVATLAGNKPATINIKGETSSLARANALSAIYQFWTKDGSNLADLDAIPTGNIFMDTMNLLFGTQGLMDMRKANASIHPMAQLSALGKGLVDTAVRNVLGGSVVAFGESLIKKGAMASSTVTSLAFVGLTAGVVLFYVLPFMPFLYFFFALAEWVKGIFEAMVGVPLWALAHLRIDGDGLAGESANSGYFLIFDIFLRPILILFGLIAAMIIFSAQVRMLNFTWDVVLDNLTGYEGDGALGSQDKQRGIVDQFFYTVLYAIIVYMMATASFKLINTIPDNLLRWMGASVTSFADMNQSSPDQLTRYAAMSGITLGQKAVEGASKFSGDMGRLASDMDVIDRFSKSGGKGP